MKMIKKNFDTDEPDFEEDDRGSVEPQDAEEFKEEIYAVITKNILSSDEVERNDALHLIPYLECDPRLSDYLHALMNDSDPNRILTGIIGLGLWAHSDGFTTLINFLTDANNKDMITPEIEEEIIISIGNIGGHESFDFLKNYCQQRYVRNTDDEDALGMAAVEGITQIAQKGHPEALKFLMEASAHSAWNMRESCADGFGVIFRGKEKIPKPVYDLLLQLSKDKNTNVQIAAYMSLDEIVGLDEANKKILADARNKQVFGG
ncbi:hypothetical protein JNM05_05805 [bacterium]|nr:hypothetical protein [bacterium]